jgi:hypothetical protein
MQKLTNAIIMVMEDLTHEVGYEPDVKAQVLAVLAGRLDELLTVHPFYDIVHGLEAEE